MEFKGTKGKWYRVKVEKTDYMSERNEVCYGDDGECVAEFIENDYDALLISKAPEMLELLSEILISITVGEISETTQYYKNKLEQLIKEATEL